MKIMQFVVDSNHINQNQILKKYFVLQSLKAEISKFQYLPYTKLNSIKEFQQICKMRNRVLVIN